MQGSVQSNLKLRAQQKQEDPPRTPSRAGCHRHPPKPSELEKGGKSGEQPRPDPQGDRRPQPGKSHGHRWPRQCPSILVIEWMLLAKIPKMLLLLLGQGGEQLALAPAPAFAHSKTRQSLPPPRDTYPTTKLSNQLTHAGRPQRFATEPGCHKAEPFYVVPVRQALELPGLDSAL